MKSTSSATSLSLATHTAERQILRAGFAVAGAALALRAAGLADFERPLQRLPSLCLFHRLTGLDCPGCGMTRAFLRLAHGDVAGAWHLHPFSIPLLLFMLALAFAPKSWLERAKGSPQGRALPLLGLGLLLAWWVCFKLVRQT